MKAGGKKGDYEWDILNLAILNQMVEMNIRLGEIKVLLTRLK